mmetsp:Transcript_10627/g.20893  ORF Transcript_10627/g.20893 Transcript_10627/m.20893 type:complete len:263 (+) Transcript_10627:260-1048(+)
MQTPEEVPRTLQTPLSATSSAKQEKQQQRTGKRNQKNMMERGKIEDGKEESIKKRGGSSKIIFYLGRKGTRLIFSRRLAGFPAPPRAAAAAAAEAAEVTEDIRFATLPLETDAAVADEPPATAPAEPPEGAPGLVGDEVAAYCITDEDTAELGIVDAKVTVFWHFVRNSLTRRRCSRLCAARTARTHASSVTSCRTAFANSGDKLLPTVLASSTTKWQTSGASMRPSEAWLRTNSRTWKMKPDSIRNINSSTISFLISRSLD